MKEYIESYANHILYCSLYSGIVTYALKSSRSTKTSLSTSTVTGGNVLTMMIGGIAAVSLYAELNYVFKRIGLPPGDSGYPIVGNLISYLNCPRGYISKRSEKYGFPFTVNFLLTPCVFISSDEDVRWANAQERKGNLVPYMPEYMKTLFGVESVLLQSASNHRRLRRIFEPSFSPTAIQGYLQQIDEIATAELEKWCNKNEYCTAKEWSALTMRLFFTCAFGDVQEDTLNTLSSLFSKWMNGLKAAIPFAIPGTCLYKAYVAGNKLNKVLQKLVDDFKAKHPPGSSGGKNSMMDRLCYGVDDDGQPLTDEQLVTNIRFLLFAGHDTTKGSFCTFAHYLVEQPKLRVMMMEEIAEFSDPLNIDELKTAPLLNAFLAETWRMIPPTGGHGMAAATDLEYKGYTIRRGVGVIADITCDAVSNQERYKNPTEFRVERWIPKGHPLHDPKYFLDNVDYNVMSVKFRAFNTGPHMCLGAHFAKLEARIVLTRLLHNYNIEIRNDKLTNAPLLHYTNEFKLIKR